MDTRILTRQSSPTHLCPKTVFSTQNVETGTHADAPSCGRFWPEWESGNLETAMHRAFMYQPGVTTPAKQVLMWSIAGGA